MSETSWDSIHRFTQKVGWTLIFDLNSLYRTDGVWNSSNAEVLIKYSIKKNYSMAGWELGNGTEVTFSNKYSFWTSCMIIIENDMCKGMGRIMTDQIGVWTQVPRISSKVLYPMGYLALVHVFKPESGFESWSGLSLFSPSHYIWMNYSRLKMNVWSFVFVVFVKEPGEYLRKFGVHLTVQQLVIDYQKLSSILSQAPPNIRGRILIGPSTIPLVQSRVVQFFNE